MAILLGPKLDYKVIEKIPSNDGRLIILRIEIQGQDFVLINSYLPNTEKEQVKFLKNVLIKMESTELNDNTAIVWGGDLNFCVDLNLKVGSVEHLQAIKEELDLCDIWRVRNPKAKRFT